MGAGEFWADAHEPAFDLEKRAEPARGGGSAVLGLQALAFPDADGAERGGVVGGRRDGNAPGAVGR